MTLRLGKNTGIVHALSIAAKIYFRGVCFERNLILLSACDVCWPNFMRVDVGHRDIFGAIHVRDHFK
jgi:hypothetical protein